VQTGSGSRSARPAGVAKTGASQGNHVTRHGSTNYTGERLHNDRSFQPTKFGNEVALNDRVSTPVSALREMAQAIPTDMVRGIVRDNRKVQAAQAQSLRASKSRTPLRWWR
jgi:hypothetical protein